MYRTDNLGDAAYLHSQGHLITSTQPRDGEVEFEFATLDPGDAEQLLRSAQRTVCATYHRSWRTVRRLIDASLGAVR
jgi:hypothetical protein